VNDTSATGLILRGVDTARTTGGSQTRLTAHLLVDGDAVTRLELMVVRLSLEPGIHAVHWHAAGGIASATGVSGRIRR